MTSIFNFFYCSVIFLVLERGIEFKTKKAMCVVCLQAAVCVDVEEQTSTTLQWHFFFFFFAEFNLPLVNWCVTMSNIVWL